MSRHRSRRSRSRSRSRSRGEDRSCPPGSAVELDPISMKPHCVQPKAVGKVVSELKEAVERADKGRRPREKEIIDLVSPYQVNPYQRRILSYVIGKDSVDRMEATNALTYAGIIDNSCPPGLEEYVHVVTGKRQCRPRLKKVVQWRGKVGCPDPQGDPYAIEHFVDAQGVGQCRRPVLQGHFRCPPHNAPDKIEHITLPDGTGVCIAPRADIDNEFFIPDHVVYPRGIMSRIQDFEKLFKQFNLNSDHIRHLNVSLLQAGGDKGDLAKRLKQHIRGGVQRTLEEELVKRIASDQDIHIAMHGLFEYARKHNPSIFNGLVPTKGEFLRMIMGDPSVGERMSGGGRRRRKKSKSKSRSRKSRSKR